MRILLLPGGEFRTVLRHARSHQFVEAEADVLDRIDSLLGPGESDGLLFEVVSFQITVGLMDNGVPPLYGIA